MNTVYDVAVVGGGIAGATAVIALSRNDLKVAWVRPEFQQETTNHKVGESLAPTANPILDALDLLHLIKDGPHRAANTTFSAWGQENLVERNSMVHLEGAGHIIDRQHFEAELIRLANTASHYTVDAIVTGVMDKEDAWHLTSHDSSLAKARFIIDATGRSQMLSKMIFGGRNDYRKTNDRLVSAYGFLHQKADSNVMVTPATIIESVAEGWWYASLLPTGALTLNYYSDSDLMPRNVTSNLDTWLALIQKTKHISYWIEDAEFEVEQLPRLTNTATRCINSFAGSNGSIGWAAIGDAAVAFDPLSAHGMTTALWAAAQMPNVVQNALAGNNAPLDKYVQAVKHGKEQYMQQKATMYAQERRFQHNAFWQRRNTIN